MSALSDAIVTQVRVAIPRGIRTRTAVWRVAREALPRVGDCRCSICLQDGDCCGCYVPDSIRLAAISRRAATARFAVRWMRNL